MPYTGLEIIEKNYFCQFEGFTENKVRTGTIQSKRNISLIFQSLENKSPKLTIAPKTETKQNKSTTTY